MSDNFVTANQALRGQEKKKPHLGVRVQDKSGNGKLDCLNEGVCTKCQQFEAKNAIFCPTCYALMHTGIERAEKLSTMGLTEAEAKKEVNWKGP
jgi:PHP family Zn ribbon phosphoesterase